MSRYVICYQGDCDPSAKEERSLMSSLKNRVRIIDRMPGTILVDGTRDALEAALGPLEGWTFSPERAIQTRPPHKQRLKSAA